MPKKVASTEARTDRAMFSIGADVSEHLDFLVGRHVKTDGTAGTSRTDVVRDLIERAYAQVAGRKKRS
jgi:hypothetical protein